MFHNKTRFASIAALMAGTALASTSAPSRRYEPVPQSAGDDFEALDKAESKRKRKQAKALKHNAAYALKQEIKNGNS